MASTVRIHRTRAGYAADGPESFVGSGFFVAPNWVLTCAHVARGGGGGELAVAYETGPGHGTSLVPAEVVATLPEHIEQAIPGSWPAPDLALVRLREPVDHECVYVAERPAAYYSEGEVFYAGWTVVDGRLCRLDGPIAVKGTIGDWSPGVQLRLGENDLPYGISGGPVVDPVRGEVIGVLKSRADHGRGGTSIGIEHLRTLPDPVPGQAVRAEHDDLYQAVCHAHDRYHRDRQRQSHPDRDTWADVQSRLGARPGRTLTAGERVQLLGRLADLPPPVSTRNLLDILDSLPEFEGSTPLPSPRGWRDGLGALYEGASDDGVRGLVLDYAMRALSAERPFVTPGTAAAEEALWDWVRQTAEGWLDTARRRRIEKQRITRLKDRRPPGARPERTADRAPRPSALLELVERGWEREHWDWQLYVTRPDGARDCVRQEERTPTEALAERLAAPLAEAFRQCDEPDWPAVLQVVLPHNRLDLPVDGWRLRPDEPPLGVRGPVVLRCGDRDRLPGERGFVEFDPGSPEWDADRADRWRWLHAHSARAEILDCDDGVPRPVPESGELRNLSPGSVPVMCRYGEHRYEDDTEALARILLGGFGVALWRRGPARSAAVCGEFHRGAAVTVADARGARQLPERVHELRRKLVASRTEAYWADGIALFYDDPNQPLPGTGELLEAP
ncbi:MULTISPECIES: trypsin-like peptidase domain-containing protein [unclassified Streptomyces]|uniref:VMAP-C domain-containing protein n=1 Tax=unclassified Streptomyces TaxID=2593676 RepID=UPI00278C7775|nr:MULTISPECIES: trypsin-like peptidase domain-containing protein [unclassified Streptomyces]